MSNSAVDSVSTIATDSLSLLVSVQDHDHEEDDTDASSLILPPMIDSMSKSSVPMMDATTITTTTTTASTTSSSSSTSDDRCLRFGISSDLSLLGHQTSLPSSSSSSSSNSYIMNTHNTVSFSTVHIRAFERIAGDHPFTSMGVPLTIGWKFVELPGLPVDVYETKRKRRDKRRQQSSSHQQEDGSSTTSSNIISSPSFMTVPKANVKNVKRVNALDRKYLLLKEFQVPLQDIRMAERELVKFQKGVEKRRRQEEKRQPKRQIFRQRLVKSQQHGEEAGAPPPTARDKQYSKKLFSRFSKGVRRLVGWEQRQM
ncbi:hypothetical protein IV203_021640 [Nitzschia inconspicua]|uniref:Uncharacterized protein n=1 Tax=Nitzschia inconspicua TaxID=303405 RepID=A0A9K3PDG6_9STRA|nr:hypothetical protein IV203_021640 [Nitzschia inconspicua]